MSDLYVFPSCNMVVQGLANDHASRCIPAFVAVAVVLHDDEEATEDVVHHAGRKK